MAAVMPESLTRLGIEELRSWFDFDRFVKFDLPGRSPKSVPATWHILVPVSMPSWGRS